MSMVHAAWGMLILSQESTRWTDPNLWVSKNGWLLYLFGWKFGCRSFHSKLLTDHTKVRNGHNKIKWITANRCEIRCEMIVNYKGFVVVNISQKIRTTMIVLFHLSVYYKDINNLTWYRFGFACKFLLYLILAIQVACQKTENFHSLRSSPLK